MDNESIEYSPFLIFPVITQNLMGTQFAFHPLKNVYSIVIVLVLDKTIRYTHLTKLSGNLHVSGFNTFDTFDRL